MTCDIDAVFHGAINVESPSQPTADMGSEDVYSVLNAERGRSSWFNASAVQRLGKKDADILFLCSHIHKLQDENDAILSCQSGSQ